MIGTFVLAGVCGLLGVVILWRPLIAYRYVMLTSALDAEDYPFTGRRVVWYRRSSIVPFAIGALFLGVAISRL